MCNTTPLSSRSHRPAPAHSGFTLIELMISMVIMASLTVMVLESLIAAQRWQNLARAEDDVNESAATALNVMSVDLAESGWWFPDTLALTVALGTDRNARYFPYVQMQAVGGLADSTGALFGEFTRPDTTAALFPGNLNANNARPEIIQRLPGALADTTTLFGANRAAYLASFFARSQELIFLKQTTSGWDADPRVRPLPSLSFPNGDWSTPAMTDYSPTGLANRAALGILMPSGWQQLAPNVFNQRAYDADQDGVVGANEGLDAGGNQLQPYGVPLLSAKLNAAAGVQLLNNWETMAVPDYDGSIAQQAFREYGYVVVPSPYSLGRLVRVYTMPAAQAVGLAVGTDPGQRLPQNVVGVNAAVIDRVVAENVVRIVCDTFRTDPLLLINEIRVRLYIAREVPSDNLLVVNRVVESILIMRAKAATAVDQADTTQAFGAVQLAY